MNIDQAQIKVRHLNMIHESKDQPDLLENSHSWCGILSNPYCTYYVVTDKLLLKG